MNEIDRVLRRASWRLLAADVLRTLTLTTTAVLVLLLIARVVNAFVGFDPAWGDVFVIAGVAAAFGAAAWSLATRPRALAVARTVDERADLRESLSTALCVAQSPDPWAAAVVETARSRAAGVNVPRAIPIGAPRLLPMPLGAATALLIVWFSLPEHFAFTKVAKERELQNQIIQAKGEVAEQKKAVIEAMKKAGIDPEKEERPEEPGTAAPPTTPEEVKREALKQMSRLQERVEQTAAEKQKQMEAMKELMKQLKQPGPGPLEEFSRAMARGDFQKAQEKLDELKKKLAEPNALDARQKEQLAGQLQKLSEQMKQMAENTSALEKDLEKAGLNREQAKQLAQDPEALKKALENMKNLSPEQKQALMNAALNAAKACQQCDGMGESMGRMAQGLSEMGLSQEGLESLEGMMGQLSDLEMLQADLEALDAAAKACQAQLAALGEGMCQGGAEGEGLCQGVGEWTAGDSNRLGGGTGQAGRSMGGSGTPEEEAAFNTRKEKANVRMGPGPSIGERLVQGNAVRGDSVAEFSAAVAVHSQNAAEEVVNMDVPPEYRDAVKRYYGRLQKRADAAAGKAPAPEAESTPDAQDAGKK